MTCSMVKLAASVNEEQRTRTRGRNLVRMVRENITRSMEMIHHRDTRGDERGGEMGGRRLE